MIHQKKQLTLDKQRIMLYLTAITCGIIGAVSLCKHGSVDRSDGEFMFANKGFVQYLFVQYFFLFIGKIAFKLSIVAMLTGVIGVFVIFFMGFKHWIRNKKNNFIIICLLSGLLFLLTTLVAYRNEPSLLSPYYRGVRNFYIPALNFVWILIELLSSTKHKVVLLSAMMFLFLIELVLFVGQFKYDDFQIKQYSHKIKTDDTLSIPINPAGWHIFIDNRKSNTQ